MWFLLLRVIGIVVLVLAILSITVIGTARLRGLRVDWRRRLVAILPELGLLVGVLAINRVARQYTPEVAWIIGIEVTDLIYRIEGDFVAWLQSLGTTEVTVYFSRMYVYGYVILLVFPVIAYLALERTQPLRTLLIAYGLNYLLGLVLYVLVIAYGPRNLVPDLVESLLYTSFPEYQTLTRQVNRSINVFPSLHASLSVTVMLMAIRTRSSYPWWTVLALVVGSSVVVSTMYLGIHWLIDVIAGVALAIVAVAIAATAVERHDRETFLPVRVYRRLAG